MPNNSGQLGRLELAIQAVRSGQITSVQKAVQLYDVPWSTLQDQLNNIQECISAHCIQHKLIETEKKTLLQWILIINKYDTSFRFTIIWSITDLLLTDCDTLKPPFTVEINWV